MIFKIKKIAVLALIIFCAQQINSQDNQREIELTGNLLADSKLLMINSDNVNPQIQLPQSEKKSALLAGVLSFVVPGAGEVYAESYWKAGIFIAIEAALITTAIIHDNKGDTQTEKFEKYANENWSVRKYAEWTLENVADPASTIYNPGINPADYQVINPDGSINWGELNRLERAGIYGYTHALPLPGDQQYYEMIGKYHQFSHGWNDANFDDTDYRILSPNYLYYSGERGKANDYYNIASKAVIGIYVNHFLSVLDAVWTTINYNKDLTVKFRLEQNNLVREIDFIPTLHMSYSF